MRGRAVPTTVWSSEAKNMVSRTAPRIVNFARGGSDMSDAGALLATGAASIFIAAGRSWLVAKVSALPGWCLRGKGFREHVLGRPRDDLDARVDRDLGAVQNHVVVPRILPSTR